MCLAIPGKIVALNGMEADVEIGGARRSAIVAFIANPQVGDYVLLHAGFAIRKWSEEDVREYNAIMQGIGRVQGSAVHSSTVTDFSIESPNRSAEGGSASGGEPPNHEPLNHAIQ